MSTTLRTKRRISLDIDPDLHARLEAWRAAQALRPTKTAVIEAALSEFLARQERRLGRSHNRRLK